MNGLRRNGSSTGVTVAGIKSGILNHKSENELGAFGFDSIGL